MNKFYIHKVIIKIFNKFCLPIFIYLFVYHFNDLFTQNLYDPYFFFCLFILFNSEYRKSYGWMAFLNVFLFYFVFSLNVPEKTKTKQTQWIRKIDFCFFG